MKPTKRMICSALRPRRVVALVAAGVLAGAIAVAPAWAGGGPKVGKIYNCYIFNFGVENSEYVQSLEFTSRTKYLVAPDSKRNHLVGRAAHGTYRMHGHRIVWKTGPYRHYKGIFHPKDSTEAARVELLKRNGQKTGVNCAQYH